MKERTLSIAGVTVPRFLYGTAWKEDRTQHLVELAIAQGFRGIDTANQRRHYHEAAVGQAIAASIAGGSVKRDDLFLQTKFTFQRGQDHRLPYDPAAPIAKQVEQSFASSLEHLGGSTIDSYLLHGPTLREGLTAEDWEAWRAIEALLVSGQARLIGISNVTARQLQALCQQARVPPAFVQNRCYASTGWDRNVRAFCHSHGIIYQGFSLLTANRQVLAHPKLAEMAKRYGKTASQIIFRFAVSVSMLPLTGTTSGQHMRLDLDAFDFELSQEERESIESMADVG